MAVLVKELVESSLITAGAPASYYAPTHAVALIDKCTLTNQESHASPVQLYLGTAGDTTNLIMTRVLAVGEIYVCPEIVGHYLNSAHAIWAAVPNGDNVAFRVGGREVTGSTSVKELVPSVLLTGSAVKYYEPANVKTAIDKCTLTNHEDANVDVVIWLGTDATSPKNLIWYRTLAPYETYICPEIVGQVLQPHNSMYAKTAGEHSVTLRVSGRDFAGYGT